METLLAWAYCCARPATLSESIFRPEEPITSVGFKLSANCEILREATTSPPATTYSCNPFSSFGSLTRMCQRSGTGVPSRASMRAIFFASPFGSCLIAFKIDVADRIGDPAAMPNAGTTWQAGRAKSASERRGACAERQRPESLPANAYCIFKLPQVGRCLAGGVPKYEVFTRPLSSRPNMHG